MKKKTIFMALAVGLVMTACEKQIMPDWETGGDDGNVRLTFIPTTADMSTRGTVAIGDYFSRLAVQLFDEDGNKVYHSHHHHHHQTMEAAAGRDAADARPYAAHGTARGDVRCGSLPDGDHLHQRREPVLQRRRLLPERLTPNSDMALLAG